MINILNGKKSIERALAGLSLLFFLGLIISCATPAPNPDLERAKAAYQQAEKNPDIEKNAPVALYEARKSLEKAEKAQEQNDIELQAYRVERQIEIATAETEQKKAENKVELLTKENEKLLLERSRKQAEQNAMQADQAKKQAEQLKKEAEVKAREAEQLKKDAETKAAEAEKARMEAEKAKEELLKLQQDMAELQAKQTNNGIVLTLGDVLFETSKAELQPGAFRTIQKVADFLLKNPKRNVLIEGYTDSRGSDEFNQQLSENRANSVRSALVDDEVPRERITIKGYGKRFPVAGNDTAAGQQQNRRVEITILNEGIAAESLFR